MTTWGSPANTAISPFDLADEVRSIINTAMVTSERSVFGNTALGVSDVGYCREYARRKILGLPRTDEQHDYLAAFIGTAVGREFEAAYAKAHPGAMTQMEITVNFEVTIGGKPFVLNIPGHPDIIDRERNLLLDGKTVDGVGAIRSSGPTDQQRYQVSLYADAAIKKRWLKPGCTVGLVYIDRSGAEPLPHVETWTHEPAIVQEAQEWLNDVLYAIAEGEEARRDQPRSWCFAVCEYATACRTDTDVEGFIDDPIILNAIQVYKEAGERVKQATKDKESAKSVLTNIDGNTSDWTIRHVEVGGSSFTVNRQPYTKLEIVPNRPARKRGSKDEPERAGDDGTDVRGAGEVPST